MSLTMGTSPFGHQPKGSFNVEIPVAGIIYVDPSPRWIRAKRGAETAIDTRRAKLLHQHSALPRYFVPRDDVRWELLDDVAPVEPPPDAPGLDGYVTFPWRAFDGWYEEDEQVLSHPIDPYHRVDVRPTSRHLTISALGRELADTTRAMALFETGLPTRWYVPRDDVKVELEPSDFHTACAYKGVASYLSVRAGDQLLENVAWTYPDPRQDASRVKDYVCFFNEHVDVDVDGEREERPMSPWSRSGWWHDSTGAPEGPTIPG
jgi:uncharacterized protein (DUF427 family)